MSEQSTTYTWQDQMQHLNVKKEDLPEKIQNRIDKFFTIKDEDVRDDMDRIICDAIDDFVEERTRQEKEKESKAKHEARKAEAAKRKLDVSNAKTASGSTKETKSESFSDRLFGRDVKKEG